LVENEYFQKPKPKTIQKLEDVGEVIYVGVAGCGRELWLIEMRDIGIHIWSHT
jgi:hypothetical protein